MWRVCPTNPWLQCRYVVLLHWRRERRQGKIIFKAVLHSNLRRLSPTKTTSRVIWRSVGRYQGHIFRWFREYRIAAAHKSRSWYCIRRLNKICTATWTLPTTIWLRFHKSYITGRINHSGRIRYLATMCFRVGQAMSNSTRQQELMGWSFLGQNFGEGLKKLWVEMASDGHYNTILGTESEFEVRVESATLLNVLILAVKSGTNKIRRTRSQKYWSRKSRDQVLFIKPAPKGPLYRIVAKESISTLHK